MKKIMLVSIAAFLSLTAPGIVSADNELQETKTDKQIEALSESSTEATSSNLTSEQESRENSYTAKQENEQSSLDSAAEKQETEESSTAADLTSIEKEEIEEEMTQEEAATEEEEEEKEEEEEEYDEELYGPEEPIVWTVPIEAVAFDHKIHTMEAGLECDSCHDELFEMEAGLASENEDFIMETMYQGGYCGACHDGDMAFAANTRCATCHIGVMGMEGEEHQTSEH